jgi:hypothetical protein
MMVSDGEFDDDDMLGVRAASARPAQGNATPCSDGVACSDAIPVTGEGFSDGRRTTEPVRFRWPAEAATPPKVRASPGSQVSGEVCSLGFSACSGQGT